MSLFSIVVGDKVTVIEAPSKSAANAYAHANIEVEVRLANKSDLTGLDLSTVPNVQKGGKTDEQIEAAKVKAEAAAAKKAAGTTAA